MRTVSRHCHLTWGWRGWSSGSGQSWCICGTVGSLGGSPGPLSQTWAFLHPPPLCPQTCTFLSPGRPLTSHCHVYHHTRQPGTTWANTPPHLPPFDWEQAEIQGKNVRMYTRNASLIYIQHNTSWISEKTGVTGYTVNNTKQAFVTSYLILFSFWLAGNCNVVNPSIKTREINCSPQAALRFTSKF